MKKQTMEDRYPKPVWLKITEEDMKKIIVDLSEKHNPAEVGLVLRDQYGVPTTKVFGKKLSAYLKEAGKYEFFDMKSVEKKVDKLKDHIKDNITDKKAKHKFQKAYSRLSALKKYSNRKNKQP